MEKESLLSIRNISKKLGDFSISNVSFSVEAGDYFVILGPSGVGKTVLLETIAGQLIPDSGRIILNGRDITREKIQKRRIGLVYQIRSLFPHLTVRQNIAYGLRMRGSRCRRRVGELAADVGVSHLLERRPDNLSGGEYQRVALARTIATDPLCLLLDEPLSNLDVQSRSGMRSLLRKLCRHGQTVVHITHDYEEALSLATRMAVMENGRILQVDEPQELFRHPKSDFVARFIGIRNFFRGELAAHGGGSVAEFFTNGLKFQVSTDRPSGKGCLILRSEDIIVSRTPSETSARNTFRGTVVDIAPVRRGIEITVDIGLEITALITRESLEGLHLDIGQTVWIYFKATAGKYLGEQND